MTLAYESVAPAREQKLLVIATLVSILGGFLFGYDNLVISGAIKYLIAFYHLDPVGQGWAASCALIGCFVGSLSAGWIVDRLGAKFGLWLCAICFGASSIGTYFAGSLISFTFWRALGGLGIGSASIVAPMYIAEIAPTRIRGRLVTLYQFGIVMGILSATFVNKIIHGHGDETWNTIVGWRWMFLAGIAPALLFAAMILPAVESPRWLMKMGRRIPAFNILSRLNGPRQAEIEAQEIEQSLNKEEGRFSELFNSFRRPLSIGIILIGISQASGIFALLTFLPAVLEAAGSSIDDAFRQTVLVGVVLAIFTLGAVALVDFAGRKTLLILGTFLQFISFAAVGWLYYTHGSGMAILVFVMIFVAAHAIGNGAVCWVIISEIFPTKIRGRAMSVATTSLWVVAYLCNLAYPTLQAKLHYSGTFWCFSAVALINLLYILFFVPETKGRSLEQIEDMWIDRRAEVV